MEKQELKEKIDQIARQNCKSWENDENVAACETAICCIVRDIKKSIDEMTEIEDKKMILRLKNERICWNGRNHSAKPGQ